MNIHCRKCNRPTPTCELLTYGGRCEACWNHHDDPSVAMKATAMVPAFQVGGRAPGVHLPSLDRRLNGKAWEDADEA